MIKELEKQGLLQTIIEQACDLSEKALADFGCGGKREWLLQMPQKRNLAKKIKRQAFVKV